MCNYLWKLCTIVWGIHGMVYRFTAILREWLQYDFVRALRIVCLTSLKPLPPFAWWIAMQQTHMCSEWTHTSKHICVHMTSVGKLSAKMLHMRTIPFLLGNATTKPTKYTSLWSTSRWRFSSANTLTHTPCSLINEQSTIIMLLLFFVSAYAASVCF